MNTVSNSQPALIVDWNSIQYYGDLHEWLLAKQNQIAVVVLVSDPANNDFNERESDAGPIGFEPSVVLRNSAKKPMPNIAFKTAAILAVQETSNLVPVVGIDGDDDVLDMYEEAGIVVTAKPEYLDKVTGLR
jgi:hypothetical protein